MPAFWFTIKNLTYSLLRIVQLAECKPHSSIDCGQHKNVTTGGLQLAEGVYASRASALLNLY